LLKTKLRLEKIMSCGAASWSFVFRAVIDRIRLVSDLFGNSHSLFGIGRSVFLILVAQMCCNAVAQAQTPNMTGTWKVEITFADERHHSLRLEAQDGGKGSLQLTDPAAKVWSAAKPSEAKWSRGEGNSVTFSGTVEFLLGNVGRDAGTLTCKGKFESADLVSGEVEFSPSVGERPSKHGTFKAVRSGT
jgi:hypothetical protein